VTTTDATVEELLSEAHVNAIIAQSGAICDSVKTDYGVDLTVRQVKQINGRRVDIGPVFDIQLKASINWELKEKYVVHDMDVDAYNKLIDRNEHRASIYCILVLCCLPRLRSEWINVSEDSLVLRNCCYYKLLSGPHSKNSYKQRIAIPRTQLLTPNRATALLDHVQAGSIV